MIFASTAPKYWANNMPVVPLHHFSDSRAKAPVVFGWQQYNDSMPTKEDQDKWLHQFPNCNMGLPLGAQSRCVALDIDTTDESIISLIDTLVPKSPWTRIGKKGKVCMFKFTGEQTFRIKTVTGETICELLSSKTQVVLPPSIHPDTQQPYVANCELIDVIDQLPVLDKNLEEILRTALVEVCGVKLSLSGSSKTIEWVSQGSRDVKMASISGIYAYAVIRGELTLKEAIDSLRAWCSTQVENVLGDPIDMEKGVRNLIKFLMNNVKGPKKRTLPKNWDVGLSALEKESLGIQVEAENVSWSYERIRDYMLKQVEASEINTTERNQAIEYVLERLAKSPDMSPIEEDQCLKYISKTNIDVSMASLRKRIAALRSDGIAGRNHTEIARSVLADLNDVIPDVVEQNGISKEFNSIRYSAGRFYKWGGSHWETLDRHEILKAISTEYGELPAATRNSDHKGIMDVMRSQVAQKLSDMEISGINFANGFLDSDCKLRPHDRKFGCVYTLPYPYTPEKASLEHTPLFKKFLDDVWGDTPDYLQRLQALREVIAATIFGKGPSYARAVLLYGIGGSGKSQLLDIVRNLLPTEVITAVPPYQFKDGNYAATLSQSILNICGELSENTSIHGDVFKQIIDGTEMAGAYKFQDVFRFKPKATHWFSSNYLPRSADTTEGFNRRWIIFSFDKIVKSDKKVVNIGASIVAEEREAIAAWAAGCMPHLSKKGDYTLPDSHFKALNDMAAENDSVFFFLTSEGGPRLEISSSIQTDKLYEFYRVFCFSVAGAKPVGLRKFYSRLKEMGILYGFSLLGSKVFGLTMEQGVGKTVLKVRESSSI